MRRRTPSLLFLSTLALLASDATLASEIVLHDGRVLAGEVERDGPNYIVLLESGDAVVLPVEIVQSIKLSGVGEPRPTPEPPPGLAYSDPRTLAGQAPPEGPSGLRAAEPTTLAGTAVRPPTRQEQLAVLGPPSEFQRNIIDPTWRPESDWDMDPSNNNFAPSTWSKGPVDSSWQPEPAWDADSDALAGSRSTFRKSIIDSSWTPTDGFRRD